MINIICAIAPFKQIKQYCDSINMENSKVREGDIKIIPFVWLYNYTDGVNLLVDEVINRWSKENEKIKFYKQFTGEEQNTDLNREIKRVG